MRSSRAFRGTGDGMIVLYVTDPYNPIEIARYLDTSGPIDTLANDFWGTYKEPKSPFICGSDRNGLYIFKLKAREASGGRPAPFDRWPRADRALMSWYPSVESVGDAAAKHRRGEFEWCARHDRGLPVVRTDLLGRTT